jgi:NAD(P)-dependent dehydrogenase (short-subunit alcohol dehydrogenase family)
MGMLDGQVAVVIGGHSGFGLAISERFAAEGAHVVIGARRIELVTEIAGRLAGTPVACDITDDAQVQALVAAALAVNGRINIAVNCAGFEQSTPLRNLTPEKLKAMHDVQIVGALYAMRHLCNAMADGGGGAYLNLSSLTAHNPTVGLTAYASAKAGIEYASQIAAVEYGAQQVRVNSIAASLIDTPMTHRVFSVPQVVQAMCEVTPLGRLGSVDDIASAALFLCSSMSGYITGQTLCVDGGASLLMLPTAQMYADVSARINAAAGPS